MLKALTFSTTIVVGLPVRRLMSTTIGNCSDSKFCRPRLEVRPLLPLPPHSVTRLTKAQIPVWHFRQKKKTGRVASEMFFSTVISQLLRVFFCREKRREAESASFARKNPPAVNNKTTLAKEGGGREAREGRRR